MAASPHPRPKELSNMQTALSLVRSFLPALLGVVISGAVGQAADELPQTLKRDGVEPRNVVFILTDDHRFDAMGCAGHPFLETPNLDSIAANGTHIKNAFVTTSLCSPSRASILTGLYTHKHRVIDNNRLVPDGTLFFPQYLQRAGYDTAFVGKWHMGGHHDDPRPGFDHWVSFRGQGNYLPPGPKYTLNVNGERVKQKGYITDELTDYAVDWLKERDDDKPFFLYLSHKAVHSNFTPAKRHQGRYADEDLSFLPTGKELSADKNTPRWVRDQKNSWHGIDFSYHSDKGLDYLYRRYCESVLAVDDSVGRVLQQLKDMGIHDDTLIIYMGDNGFMWGEHGLIDKRVSYEASIRVPMLMQCPNLFDGGQPIENVVGNIDVGPTILHAAGLQTPEYMDGQSFLDLPNNRDADWRKYFLYVYYWEKNFPQTPTQFALRGDRFKYITYYGLWDTDELYDLQTDPDELYNLIHDPDYKSVAKEMEDQLYAMLGDEGGMDIPMNQPRGGSNNKRWSEQGGSDAADFPKAFVVEEPINRNAN
ncbi:sulfatase family protein [Rhodopirellula baltica]|uniref:Mucin-desulfating sulfatase (N-acetylglucosamine-6-sulfatase) n=1 Tax=Rhodopirellula baltica WH47 TaxID=991778 RepID=F2AY18_RHOBT|nr:sulfatase [Rhodopirellula baltica]EGF25470.1 mucin-desulfating sulfatase (N-acetylglucosamine-6-sulfatase) [Rhodopirellula baltica WH47]